ncbi:MAG TPA: UPF0158 family protein [Paludibaculum sp.]|jgi:hypothetical protein
MSDILSPMGKPVLLRDVADAIGWHMDEGRSFLDVESGEVVSVSPMMDDYEEMCEEIDGAMGERYLALPDQSDYDELDWMREYALGVKDRRVGNKLMDATDRPHPFRRFKDVAQELGEIDGWHQFRDQQLRAVALDWCEENEVEWREGDVT